MNLRAEHRFVTHSLVTHFTRTRCVSGLIGCVHASVHGYGERTARVLRKVWISVVDNAPYGDPTILGRVVLREICLPVCAPGDLHRTESQVLVFGSVSR